MTKRKRLKDKQYNDQNKKEQRTNNAMTKRKRPKNRQCNDQQKKTKGQTMQ